MKTKYSLNKSERKVYAANLERLRSAGVVLGVETETSSGSPLIRIDQSGESFIYAGELGGIALAVAIRITALKSGVTILSDEFFIPGCDPTDIFVVNAAEESVSYKVFEFIDLERDAVLNHRIFNGRPLPCKHTLDGIVLAQSFAMLPSYFQTGARVSGKIGFVDESENLYMSDLELIVERHAQSYRRKRSGEVVGWQYRGNGAMSVGEDSPRRNVV